MKYDELWFKAYDERTKLITDFYQNYNLTVDDKYKNTLEDMITNASLVEKEEKKKEAVKAFVDGIQFQLEKEEYGIYTYTAIVENTLDYDIKSLTMKANLIDQDGVTVETQYVALNNIAKGEKGKLEFTTNETFEKVKVVADDYYELGDE